MNTRTLSLGQTKFSTNTGWAVRTRVDQQFHAKQASMTDATDRLTLLAVNCRRAVSAKRSKNEAGSQEQLGDLNCQLGDTKTPTKNSTKQSTNNNKNNPEQKLGENYRRE